MISIQGSKLKLIKVAFMQEITCKIKLKTKNFMKCLVKSQFGSFTLEVPIWKSFFSNFTTKEMSSSEGFSVQIPNSQIKSHAWYQKFKMFSLDILPFHISKYA